jgi:hypothetical protein
MFHFEKKCSSDISLQGKPDLAPGSANRKLSPLLFLQTGDIDEC